MISTLTPFTPLSAQLAIPSLQHRDTQVYFSTQSQHINTFRHRPPPLKTVVQQTFGPPPQQLFVLDSVSRNPLTTSPQSLLKSSFNQPVDHLPSSLQKIKLNKTFNQPVDHLPFFLTILNSTCRPSSLITHDPIFWASFWISSQPPPFSLPPFLIHLRLRGYTRRLDYLPLYYFV